MRNWSTWEVWHSSLWIPTNWELAEGFSYLMPGRTQTTAQPPACVKTKIASGSGPGIKEE